MTFSLRTRLLLGIVAGMVILLFVFSGIIYTVISHTLTSQFDRSLLSSARLLSAVIEDEKYEEDDEEENEDDEDEEEETGQGIDFEIDIRMIPEFDRVSGSGYYQLHRQDGRIIARSPNLDKAAILPSPELSQQPVHERLQLPSGTPGRMTGFWFMPRGDGSAEQFEQATRDGRLIGLVLARDAAELYNRLGFLRWLLTGASGAVIVLTVLVAGLVVRTGLAPVRAVADQIAAVGPQKLDARLGTNQVPGELLPVVTCLNDLLIRLEESFNSQRRFNADVAHELRTPLAGLQSSLEVCLTQPRQPQDYQLVLQTCLDISKSMHRMIETLFDLTKLDSGQMTLDSRDICLKGLIYDAWENFSDRAKEKKLSLTDCLDDTIRCTSDKTYLEMIISNILENAVEYSDPDGEVRVSAKESDDSVLLTISNPASALNAADAEKVFDFFWRKDTSRTNTGMHCGVGLAVVQRLVKALDGRVSATVDNGIFTMQLILPSNK